MRNTVPPGSTVGVIGGGQLGRMLAEAATPLGIDVVALDPTPNCPAVPPATDQIEAEFDDEEAIRALAERSDVLTVEIELADPDALQSVSADLDVPAHPHPDTIRMTRDKLSEKRRLDAADIPVPAFAAVDSERALRDAFQALGSPLMVKARRGGYDGRGNAIVESVAEATNRFGSLDGLVAEELVPFERELSVIGVRGVGDRRCFPVAENVHEAEILRETLVPARTDDSVRRRAQEVAEGVLNVLDGRGVFGIELFETGDGSVLVNEIAPRPHNSGHYTIEGAVTSQFEQHLRAVLGLPLGGTGLRDPTAMANLLGDGQESRPASVTGVESVLELGDVHLHWYGKRTVRPLRKMGHLTAHHSSLGHARERVQQALEALSFG
ncbi:MAG: 5-(carboxyamino)imidazole ribonucleotide synthase [Halodesulfurarchaeum sp.]